MSYITHLTWEFGWLVGHNFIINNPSSPWTFAWWAYIDGGDRRYAEATSLLISMELLSVCNGTVGIIALFISQYIPKKSRLAVMLMTGTAVVHLYSALLYYLSEILDGLPNVEYSFVGIFIKFGLANSPWVIVPWFIFWWSWERLKDYHSKQK